MWKAAGFVLGFVPTFFGDQRSFFLTVEAVKIFVEQHYQSQIAILLSKADVSRKRLSLSCAMSQATCLNGGYSTSFAVSIHQTLP
jgi:demethoxyubiquinone hydroxylase (CLK1/Coq7/Cat5 family)